MHNMGPIYSYILKDINKIENPDMQLDLSEQFIHGQQAQVVSGLQSRKSIATVVSYFKSYTMI